MHFHGILAAGNCSQEEQKPLLVRLGMNPPHVIGRPLRQPSRPPLIGVEAPPPPHGPKAPPPTSKQARQDLQVLRGPDVHLIIIQVARACIFGMGAVVTLAGLASEAHPRQRLQCALSSGVCLLSYTFYYHLYLIRKRPLYAGYSLEGNSVVDALRYSSWAVEIALLAWIAFLLRGPFAEDHFAGMSYATWTTNGPLFASVAVLLGIPGWHAARSYKRDQDCASATWLVVAFILLVSGLSLSIFVGVAMRWPGRDGERQSTERRSAVWIASTWFIYPLISFLRTLCIMGASIDDGDGVLRAFGIPRDVSRKAAMYASDVAWVIQKIFSTVVMGPMTQKEVDAIDRILTTNSPEEAPWTQIHTTPPPLSPWVSQLFDSAIAVLDILCQGFAAFTCVREALPVDFAR